MESGSVCHQASLALLDLTGVSDAQLTALLPVLSKSELARYQRIARIERKRQFLGGRLLLRHGLAGLPEIGAASVTVTERERQAPLLQIDGCASLPFFSISHSGPWVACACSATVALGLDIELINTRRDLEAISRHTFAADDLAWLARQADRATAFYRLWSIKEARFKLTQAYAIAATEHVLEFAHPAMSVVLMSAQALDRKPDMNLLEWPNLANFFLRLSVNPHEKGIR